jgi:hypothetical protein
MPEKHLVNRVSSIVWWWGCDLTELERNDWYLSTAITSSGQLSLFEYVDSDSEVTLRFWSSETDGGRILRNQSDSNFFEALTNPASSFSGNPEISKIIMCLGYLPWEDELEIEDDHFLVQSSGHGEGSEVSLEDHRRLISNNPECLVAASRNIFVGPETVMDATMPAAITIPADFNPVDELEMTSAVIFR